MSDEYEQALEQLRARCKELTEAGHAQDHELARDIYQLHAFLVERYTTPRGRNSALGAFSGGA